MKELLTTAAAVVLAATTLTAAAFLTTKTETAPVQAQAITPNPTAASSGELPETFTTQAQETEPSNRPGTTPKIFKITVATTDTEDLRVRQGQRINKGDVIADRTRERSQLTQQRESLARNLEKIKGQAIIEAPAMRSAAPILDLPDARFDRELAEIHRAEVAISQIENSIRIASSEVNTPPDNLSAAVDEAREAAAEAERQAQIQEKKADQINQLNLPSYYTEHESAITDQRKAENQKAAAAVETANAKIAVALEEKRGKLRDLEIQLSLAQADLNLAKSQLQAARTKRQEDEYKHSIALAQRTEEENQARVSHYNQLATTSEQRRNKEFQLAELEAKIAAADEKLQAIATVKSPYSGVVRRVKVEKQVDNSISASITIAVDDQQRSSDRSPDPTSSTSSTGNRPRGAGGSRARD